MTSSMMDGNLPEMIIIPLEEKDLKKMLLEVEKVLQALTITTHPKEIQMAHLEGQVVLVAKETALMTLVMTSLPAEKGLNLMVKVAKHHKIMMMIEKDESLPKIIICLEEKDHKEKVDLAVEKEAMMISLEERILKMEMQMPVIFMEGKDQNLAQIPPIAEDQEMTSMKMRQGMTQMTPTIVVKDQGMIQMIPTAAAKDQDMTQMTPTIVVKDQGMIQMTPTIVVKDQNMIRMIPTAAAKDQDMIQMTPTIAAKDQNMIRMIQTMVAKALLALMQVMQKEEKVQEVAETMQIFLAVEDLKIDMAEEVMMMMMILILMIPMVKHQDLDEKVPRMT